MQSDIPSAGSGISSVEEVEAIVRRVLADALAQQQHGGPAALASRSTSSGEMLNLKDFELPDDLDLGSTFTAVTLPNEIKQGGGEGEKGAVVSREEGMLIHHNHLSLSRRISSIHRPLHLYAFHNTERHRHG